MSQLLHAVPCKSLRNSFAKPPMHDSSMQYPEPWAVWFDCAQHNSACAQDFCHYSKARLRSQEILNNILHKATFARQVHTKAEEIVSKGSFCTTPSYKSLRNSFERQPLHDSSMQKLRNSFVRQLLQDSSMQQLQKKSCKVAFARQLHSKIKGIALWANFCTQFHAKA